MPAICALLKDMMYGLQPSLKVVHWVNLEPERNAMTNE